MSEVDVDDSAEKDEAAALEDAERERRRRAVDGFLESRRKWKKVKVTTEEILAWRHEGHRF